MLEDVQLAGGKALTTNADASRPHRRKLIEVALPLEAINEASAKEKNIRHAHPSTLHLWWARRPLAACRAVLFCQLVDDPSSVPEEFPSEEEQAAERDRLFRIIEDLVQWENSGDEGVLYMARMEIARSVARSKDIVFNGKMGKKEVLGFLAKHAPPVLDPFCGGGSIPLEAQRLGLRAYGSDLNPVAVLITKALIEIPPKFAGRPPVNPQARANREVIQAEWEGARGLAEDVRFYGVWVRDEAAKRIGHLYPKVRLPKDEGGREATVIAWLWVRTVRCPNPACGAEMPLAKSFLLSKKTGNRKWVVPSIDHDKKTVDFSIGGPAGEPTDPPKVARGAKFRCLVCGQVAADQHVKDEGTAKRMGAKLMAVAAEGDRQRVYLPPTDQDARIADAAKPTASLREELPDEPRAIWCRLYGLTTYQDLFTPRQLVALTTFSDLIRESRERVLQHARAAGFPTGSNLEDGGEGAEAYADAVATYLQFGLGKFADLNNALVTWKLDRECPVHLYARQAIPMAWDFVEANPFSESSGSWEVMMRHLVPSMSDEVLPAVSDGHAFQQQAWISVVENPDAIVCTDPPYYDNIGYADLSDFFYVWHRRSLGEFMPKLLGTIVTPKGDELIASPYRHDGDKDAARRFFEDGIARVFQSLAVASRPALPTTIFYAFKQAESETYGDRDDSTPEGTGRASTGWETFLGGLLRSALAIEGTWPIRTEMAARQVASGTNALASSIVLACRPRPKTAGSITRRELQAALRSELPPALKKLQQGNIAPVDLPQAAIGPGMAVFSRYNEVLVPDGSGGTRPMTVREALQHVNQALDEFLSQTEGDLDSETRVALSWYEQHGFKEGPFGDLEGLLKAKNTATNAMEEAGILRAKGGKAGLVPRDEMPEDWNPATDSRLTAWECLQHAIRVYQSDGEEACGRLVSGMRGKAETVRTLAYRLYTVCERKKWAEEARAYNELISAWPHIQHYAQRASEEWSGPLDRFGGGAA